MSVYESAPSRAVPLGAVAIFSTVNAVERAVTAIVSWRRARATRQALERLSDLQLNDIGILRGNITQIADRVSRG